MMVGKLPAVAVPTAIVPEARHGVARWLVCYPFARIQSDQRCALKAR